MTQQYGSLDYWENRYENDSEYFDWYQKWEGVKNVLQNKNLKIDSKILMVGCGTSVMSYQMYNDGYTNITNIDYSTVCIRQMKEKYAHIPELIYKVADVTDMNEFQEDSFDIVIDKGTLDSIMCGDNSSENIEKMLNEINRILKQSGTYICISYGEPSTRLHLMQNSSSWDVTYETVKKPCNPFITLPLEEEGKNVHYIYFCKKEPSN